ncbi:MAG TPA: hypothetical protein DCZ10_15595 [Pelotomaculum sp.]|nr:hypothetical protein [Pelotomaculum sp.]
MTQSKITQAVIGFFLLLGTKQYTAPGRRGFSPLPPTDSQIVCFVVGPRLAVIVAGKIICDDLVAPVVVVNMVLNRINAVCAGKHRRKRDG